MNKFYIFPACVMAFAIFCIGSCQVGKNQLENDPPTGEHTHWYGTVTSVDKCRVGKYTLKCYVYVEGRAEPYQLYVDDFPGGMVEKGDRIGYTHRENTRGFYVFKRRNDQLMPQGYCVKPMRCVARYNEEHGYSK